MPINKGKNGGRRKEIKMKGKGKSTSSPVTCLFCSKVCSSKTALELHTNLHTGERPFQCDECDINYADHRYLWTHRNAVHLGKTYECGKCDYVSRFRANVDRHLKMCGTPAALERMKKMKNAKKGKKSVSAAAAAPTKRKKGKVRAVKKVSVPQLKHEQSKKLAVAVVASVKVTTGKDQDSDCISDVEAAQLQRPEKPPSNLKMVYLPLDDPRAVYAKKCYESAQGIAPEPPGHQHPYNLFWCANGEITMPVFSVGLFSAIGRLRARNTKSSLASSATREISDDDDEQQGESLPEKELISSPTKNIKKPFQCKHCKKRFSSRSTLKRHIETIHSIRVEKPLSSKNNNKKYPCPLCPARFSWPQNVPRHMGTAHNVYPEEATKMEAAVENEHMDTHHLNESPSLASESVSHS